MLLMDFDHELIRPTKDIVKEFIFNCLANIIDISACRVCDLFAGTGGLGIEALSRGATDALFVENDPKAARLIRENLQKSKLSDQSILVQENALKWLEQPCPEAFEVIIADPPYALRCGNFIVEKVGTNGYLSPHGFLVLETDPNEEVMEPGNFYLHKKKKWGHTMIRIFRYPNTENAGTT